MVDTIKIYSTVVLFCFIIFGAGVLTGYEVFSPDVKRHPETRYLNKVERTKTEVIRKIRSREIVLHIVDDGEWTLWNLRQGRTFQNMILGQAEWTNKSGNVCEIWVPEMYVVANPTQPWSGTWGNKDNGDTLAHELLHCEAGDWHSPASTKKGS